MARPTTRKPTPRRAPVTRKVKDVAASSATAAPVTVEWPVDAVETKTDPDAATKLSEVEPAAEPVAADAEQNVTVTLSPSFAADEAATTKGHSVMTDAMETAKTYAEEAKTRFQSAVAEMNDKTRTAMEKSAKVMEELSELAKGNMEALVESSKIAAKGMESMSQEAVEFGRKSIEKSTATLKSLAAVKSPTEFFQLQSELMSATLDSFASEAAKNSEAMLKFVGDVSQPISNRVAVVTEKMKALAA